ncbi:MAG: PKD domain-containing protein [Candidatus Hodarchaeota archaeon]
MRKIKFFPYISIFISLFIMTSFLQKAASAFPYVINDFNFYATPDTPNPEWGVPYIDPVFGTEIIRITDAEKYRSAGYPKWGIENCDGTKLLIYKHYIYNANTFEIIHDMPRNCWDTKDPDQHWSAEDPNVLYITYGKEFLKYNVETGERTVLMDFRQQPELASVADVISRVYTMEEGDASDDRRYWPLIVRCYDANHDPTWYNSHLLMLDKDANGKDKPAIISIMDNTHPNWRGAGFISASPSGKYVHVGAPPSYIYSWDFESLRRIETHGHVDLAIDDTGREVIVWIAKYAGPDGYSSVEYGYWVKMADIETGEEFWLAPFGKAAVFHASGNCHKKPGWAAISCYLNESEDYWQSAQIIMYELTRRLPARPDWTNHGKVWRVAHTHVKRERYADDPFAKLNLKGTKIWFQSGWGKSYNDGGPINVYQINLPSTWYEDLKNINVPPVAFISADPTSGPPPLAVNFTGSATDSDGTVVSYAWDFGDGSKSNEQKPIHTYNSVGTFKVTLTVTDNKGDCGRASTNISVTAKSDNTPPESPAGLRIVAN